MVAIGEVDNKIRYIPLSCPSGHSVANDVQNLLSGDIVVTL